MHIGEAKHIRLVQRAKKHRILNAFDITDLKLEILRIVIMLSLQLEVWEPILSQLIKSHLKNVHWSSMDYSSPLIEPTKLDQSLFLIPLILTVMQ